MYLRFVIIADVAWLVFNIPESYIVTLGSTELNVVIVDVDVDMAYRPSRGREYHIRHEIMFAYHI